MLEIHTFLPQKKKKKITNYSCDMWLLVNEKNDVNSGPNRGEAINFCLGGLSCNTNIFIKTTSHTHTHIYTHTRTFFIIHSHIYTLFFFGYENQQL